MQVVELYINNVRVDLFKDESITLTDSIQNIKDISKVLVLLHNNLHCQHPQLTIKFLSTSTTTI